MYRIKQEYEKAFDVIFRSHYKIKDPSTPTGLVAFSKNHDIVDYLKELNILDVFFDWCEPIELVVGKSYKLKQTPQYRAMITTLICDVNDIFKYYSFTYLGQYETLTSSAKSGNTIKEKRNIFKSVTGSNYVEFSVNFINDYVLTEVQ